jgi:hypothetical protein
MSQSNGHSGISLKQWWKEHGRDIDRDALLVQIEPNIETSAIIEGVNHIMCTAKYWKTQQCSTEELNNWLKNKKEGKKNEF